MTLEKLLIFGFAIAALFAITVLGTNMMNNRGEAATKFDTELGKLEQAGGY